MPKKFVKDPDAVLDYSFNWSRWLGVDTISAADVTATSGLTVDSVTYTDEIVTTWLSGGSENGLYTVTCSISTASGRREDRSITIEVSER